jgi:hypothetical protein
MGKISFTMDIWTDDFDKKPYMAVTAHWLEQASLQISGRLQQKINLRTDLIGFIHIPGSHSGERLAEVFLWILKRFKFTDHGNKVKNFNFIQVRVNLCNLTDWMDYNG